MNGCALPVVINSGSGNQGITASVPVAEYVLRSRQAQGYLARLQELLVYSLPLYAEEGKTSLVIAVGCTGGHHRSVAMAHALAELLRGRCGCPVTESHRDLDRNRGEGVV